MKLATCLAFLIAYAVCPLWGQEGKPVIEVFPSSPFYQSIIYVNLVIFWIAIIGLIVIIRMKLREIERRQKMGLGRDNRAVPPSAGLR